MENEVIKDTKRCDDCGTIHNKDELVKHFQGHYFVCRGCIANYRRMYKKN